MPANGKNSEKIEETQAEDVFSELRVPTSPVPGDAFVVENRHSKAWKFYMSIDWPGYWDEFNSSIDGNGKLVYKTAYHFCRKKAKNNAERELLYEMIGPKPTPGKGKTLRVPWLGDWQRRRTLGFWSLEDEDKVVKIEKALKERDNSLQALEAVSPLTLESVYRWTRLAQQIDEMFGGRPLLPDESPTSKKNVERFHLYLDMQTKVFERHQAAINAWQKIHGVPEMGVEHWLKMMSMMAARGGMLGAMMANNGSLPTPATPQGTQVAGPQSPVTLNGLTGSHLLLAQAMLEKAQMYPGIKNPVEEEEETPRAVKGNGKVVHQ